jgi:hypothetical protein
MIIWCIYILFFCLSLKDARRPDKKGKKMIIQKSQKNKLPETSTTHHVVCIPTMPGLPGHREEIAPFKYPAPPHAALQSSSLLCQRLLYKGIGPR